MQVLESTESFRKALDSERCSGRTIGLVPTMGAMHDGHVSLMRRAGEECDVVAATIFVNPLQFGPHEDLDRYPRDLERDRAMADAAGVDYLFAPTDEEMYPRAPCTRVTVVGSDQGLEAASRPGHLEGVATVVTKLFALAGPCRAYFGEKDHEQLEVVRRLASDLSFPVQVTACPTVRAPDGLALSSRNAYLSEEERRVAPVLYRALRTGAARVEAGERDPAAVRRAMRAVVESEALAELDYAETRQGEQEWRLFVAARVGTTRLIDNVGVPVRD
ncbi:MAG: pantoate--beta-alanine ligase [Actinomycetota bacterium]|nr:pantoate--beta-alanine ligase [Actinomycetota bacterium]MDQ3679210.1 pantoate--beta-alanine ligase [Actinomycetota bacterium]